MRYRIEGESSRLKNGTVVCRKDGVHASYRGVVVAQIHRTIVFVAWYIDGLVAGHETHFVRNLAEVVARLGPVRAIATKTQFANRYSVECSRCNDVQQGVKTLREAKAAVENHGWLCGETVHQGVRDEETGEISSLCCNNGKILTQIWDVTCPDCRERRAEMKR